MNLEPAQILAKLPAELSGGMRKRVGLARAIVGEPRILLYDEPVTGLDPVNTAAVEHLITAISERMGVTSIVVTHDIEGALAISDRIALLDHGKLRFVGDPGGLPRKRGAPRPGLWQPRRRAGSGAQDHGGTVSDSLPVAPPARGHDRELIVGLFVIVGVLSVLGALFTFTDAALFRGRYIVTTIVPDAGGIRKGDPVQMRGVNIGRVKSFHISPEGVAIRLEVEGEYKIPSDSRVELEVGGASRRHRGRRRAGDRDDLPQGQ